MSNFSFDEQVSLDQMNFAEKGRPALSPTSWHKNHLVSCLLAAGELGQGEGLSFAPSLALGDCSVVLRYKPKSNIVQNVLFYPA